MANMHPASAVAQAIKKGRLANLAAQDVRCTDCGKRATVYDHRDYAKPLDVEPVCRSCNGKRGPAINKHVLPPSVTNIKSVSVKVLSPAYKILKEHAVKTGKNMSFLIARAILRCYAKEGTQ